MWVALVRKLMGLTPLPPKPLPYEGMGTKEDLGLPPTSGTAVMYPAPDEMIVIGIIMNEASQ